MRRIVPIAALVTLLVSMPAAGADNPAAEGFNEAASDPEAIAIADEVMAAMGGRESYDQTRYLSWNFFDFRTHVWDKWTGALRFEQGPSLTLMNVNTREGRSWENGDEINDPAALEAALKAGYEAWVNDSYWLLMPYKLKDSGVTLKLLGDGTTEAGHEAHLLQLTFENVGVTPDNKYHIFVHKDCMLVEQWNFFDSYEDEEPRFTTPWAHWRLYGDILLSGDRGERQLSDIQVFEELPARVFESTEPIDLEAYQ
jgi:hypothetical protein